MMAICYSPYDAGKEREAENTNTITTITIITQLFVITGQVLVFTIVVSAQYEV